MGKQVAYLGPPGTFCQRAATEWVARQSWPATPPELVPMNTITDVALAVKDGLAEAGIVPIENSIEGTVNLTLDLLFAVKEIKIQGEVVLEIEHYLATEKNKAAGPIEVIYSHPQALAQCRQYLERHYPTARLVPTASTGAAARLVSTGAERAAAIVSRAAVELYGLEVIAAGIQDFASNKTRFVVLGHGIQAPTGRDKTSLVLALRENRPGGLYDVLHEFAEAAIDLTKIESRPAKRELGDYVFFIDCEGHIEDVRLAGVISRLQQKTALLEILGSYPRWG